MRNIHREQWIGWARGMFSIILIGTAMRVVEQAGAVWLLPIIFSAAVLIYVWGIRPRQMGQNDWLPSRQGTLLTGLGAIVSFAYFLTNATLTAWGTTIFVFALLLCMDNIVSASLGRPTRWLIHFILAIVCGGLIVILAQLESHFADEEFFVVLQALVLAVFWLALRGVWNWLSSRPLLLSFPQREDAQIGLPFSSRWLAPVGISIVTTFLIFAIYKYQHSFYTTQIPSYPGISAETPFLCGQAAPDPQTYSGQDTFRRLLELVETNPHKTTPEYGMLALGNGEARWIQAFHDSLLNEARQGLFTGAADSVKSVQHDASLRVYYYSRMQDTFPDLFTPTEDKTIRQWFAAINRRALTAEWVDWMYALAFSQWPAGPYENQESGAGLLALLETTGFSDPLLSPRNQFYLNANPRGWMARFRVTDDAAVYQPEWIDNAYFQSQYTGDVLSENVQNSFEWLLLQSLPDGTPLKYNHAGAATLDGIVYLGAKLTGDSRYLWAAGRTMDYLESQKRYIGAQPGLEADIDLIGYSPTQGSCLIYGDSGLPNQEGPLAPDKIVFRDGWTKDSTYLMLNLRFTGWHRYKASNAIVQVYQDGPLVVEELSGDTFSWLPTGRSLFRDKRIPRENLNGLVVARSGLSAVLSTLTGIGGAWAQDPPYYASVENFTTGPEMDTSTTVIESWHGWTQRRTIYFYHGGLIVVVDDAQGPASSPAALVWHFPNGTEENDGRIYLRLGENPAEMVLVPLVGNIQPIADGVQFEASGRITLVTVLLTQKWVGAEVNLTANSLKIIQENQKITLPIPEEIP